MTRKIAIVTGSSKGIGKPIALAFASSKQYDVLVNNAGIQEDLLLTEISTKY